MAWKFVHMYQNFKLCCSGDTYFIYKKIRTYSKEFLSVNMILSLREMIKSSSIKTLNFFHNIAFEENTVIERNMFR